MFSYQNLHSELSDRFGSKKKYNSRLASVYKSIGLNKRSERVAACGTYLEFGYYDDNSVKLHTANFCKDVLCPVCAWRKSLKMYSDVYKCVTALKDNYKFIFVTLTLKNCKGSDLSDTIDLLQHSYTKLMRTKRMSFVQGAYKSLEITYRKETDKFHPHLHIIFAVAPNYFTSSDYLLSYELSSLWKSALGVSYTPVVYIEKIKPKKGKDALACAVAEVAKYPCKASDYLCNDDKTNEYVVQALSSALAHRRMFEFYGVFAKVRKALKLEEKENDLIHIDIENKSSGNLLAYLRFYWDKKFSAYVMYDVIKNDTVDYSINQAGKGGTPFGRGFPLPA